MTSKKICLKKKVKKKMEKGRKICFPSMFIGPFPNEKERLEYVNTVKLFAKQLIRVLLLNYLKLFGLK
jgi:hypothetical protein